MSADGDEESVRHEIVIVKRRGGHEDEGHHGAAWKIAYADFMTAMMAFFLVMWLVNISPKKQIVEVAAYFNPIKLTDKVTSPKGIHKMDLDEAAEVSDDQAPEKKKDDINKIKSKSEAAKGSPAKGAGQDSSKKPDAVEGQSKLIKSGASRLDAGHGSRLQDAANDEMFRDPFAMLTRLAAESPSKQPSTSAPLEVPATGLDTSTDPFDPKAARRKQTGSLKAGANASKQSPSENIVVVDPAVVVTPPTAAKQNESNEAQIPGQAKTAQPGKFQVDAVKLDEQIERAIQANKADNLPAIEVARIPEGVLISLTDKSDFGMFGVGAAVPQPELVRLMGSIGKTLAGFTGNIVIRGHTDARAYRSETYDNWRLSTSRAHAAYFMLVKGGLDEKRIVGVEGHADRIPKTPSDPLAPANRRIEILLKEDKS